MTVRCFPDRFLWGTATSSHQVEGGNTASDWSAWEARPGRIFDGSRAGDACGWWAGRAEEDLARAAALGQNAHRLSLEWSRLEPRPGQYDAAAFARYAAILGAMGPLGLKAMVTVNHFTLPAWAAAERGWTWDGLVPRFAAFSAECIGRLGGRVALWATLNEPSVLVLMGYLKGDWPPGGGGLKLAGRALANMMRGHAAARLSMKEVDPAAQVGIVLNVPALEPADPGSALDRAVVAAQDWIFSGVVLHGLETGLLVPPLFTTRPRVKGLQNGVDWVGLNYYGLYRVKADAAAEGLGKMVQEPSIRTAHGDWGMIAPSGLSRGLLRLAKLSVPLYVTENGVLDAADSLRPRYLIDHLAAVHDALRLGADVRGYFHWSLLDNFEWAEGYAAKFGLIAVDFKTQERRERPSAQIYARICRENALGD